MKTNNETLIEPIGTQPVAVTRRSFIKRTSSAAVVAVLALGGFENEVFATEEGSGSERIGVMYTFNLAGDLVLPVTPGFVQGPGSQGQFSAIVNAITNAVLTGNLPEPPTTGSNPPVFTRLWFPADKPNTPIPLNITVTPNNLQPWVINYKPDGTTVESIKLRGGIGEFGVIIFWAND